MLIPHISAQNPIFLSPEHDIRTRPCTNIVSPSSYYMDIFISLADMFTTTLKACNVRGLMVSNWQWCNFIIELQVIKSKTTVPKKKRPS